MQRARKLLRQYINFALFWKNYDSPKQIPRLPGVTVVKKSKLCLTIEDALLLLIEASLSGKKGRIWCFSRKTRRWQKPFHQSVFPNILPSNAVIHGVEKESRLKLAQHLIYAKCSWRCHLWIILVPNMHPWPVETWQDTWSRNASTLPPSPAESDPKKYAAPSDWRVHEIYFRSSLVK